MTDDRVPTTRARRGLPRLRLLLLLGLTSVLLVQTAAAFWGLITITGRRMITIGASIGSDWYQNGDGWQLTRIRLAGGIPLRRVQEDGPAANAGLRDGDLVVTVNGQSAMAHPGEYFRARLRGEAGDSLHLTWLRDGASMSGAIVLPPRESRRPEMSIHGRTYLSLPYGLYHWTLYGDIAVLYALLLLVGSVIGFFGLRDARAFWFATFLLSLGIGGFEPNGFLLVPLWPLWFLLALGLISMVCTSLIGWIALRTFVVFPSPTRLGNRLLRWQWVALLLGVHILGLTLQDLADLCPVLRPAAASLSWLGLGGAPQIVWLLMIIALFVAQRVETRGQPQRRVKAIEVGFTIIGAGIVVNLVGQFKDAFGIWNSFTAYVTLWYAHFASFPVILVGLTVVAYGILARRVFGFRFVLRRGLQHLLLSRGVLLIEAFLVFLLIEELLRRSGAEIARSIPFVAGLSMATGAVFLGGLRRVSRPLMEKLDRRFFVEAHDARRLLLDVGQQVSTMRAGPEVIATSGRAILSALHPERAAVLMLQPDVSNGTVGAWAENGRVTEGSRWKRAAQVAEDPFGPPVGIPDDVLGTLREGRPWVDLPNETEGTEQPPSRSSPPWELVIPVRAGEDLLGCIALAGKLSEEPYSSEDKELLLAMATQMGLALKNVELIEVAKREAQQARDIEIARKVQQGLFPKELPRAEGWELAALCRPARAVGGDYYDLFTAGPDRIVVALGDVSGKGLGASLLMANLHALIRSLVPQSLDNLAALMAEINDYLYASTPPEMFATLFLGVLELRTGRFRYANAGHPPPWLLSMAAREHRQLPGGGIPAGMMPGMPFEEGNVALDPGDTLLVYSDGVTEAADAGGALFEETALEPTLEALCEIAASQPPAPTPAAEEAGGGTDDWSAAEHVLRFLVERVDLFAAGMEQADDISLVVVRRMNRP